MNCCIRYRKVLINPKNTRYVVDQQINIFYSETVELRQIWYQKRQASLNQQRRLPVVKSAPVRSSVIVTSRTSPPNLDHVKHLFDNGYATTEPTIFSTLVALSISLLEILNKSQTKSK